MEYRTNFSFEINNPYLKVLIFIGVLGLLAFFLARPIIKGRDLRASYSGKVLKKGKSIDIAEFILTSRRRYGVHTSDHYLVIENKERKREKYYCSSTGYNNCKVGDTIKKSAGKMNNPKPIRKDSINNKSEGIRDIIEESGVLDEINKMKKFPF